jgi:two-component system NarL family response regulator
MIRILIADDHELFREGLRVVLDLRPDFEVVAEAANVAETVAAHARHQPDLILLDLQMPDGTGIDALKVIRKAQPDARVLMLTTYDGDEDIHRAIAAGASGYLLKSIPSIQLEAAVRAVIEGRQYLPPAVEERLAERAAFQTLTARELEILALIARGLSNKDVARVLTANEFTVKAHVRNILAKLGVETRTEAAILAVQRGLVQV